MSSQGSLKYTRHFGGGLNFVLPANWLHLFVLLIWHYFLSSSDISSLYTNVSLDETFAICAGTLHCSHIDLLFSEKVFLEVIYVATKSVEFSFNTPFTNRLTEFFSSFCRLTQNFLLVVSLIVISLMRRKRKKDLLQNESVSIRHLEIIIIKHTFKRLFVYSSIKQKCLLLINLDQK